MRNVEILLPRSNLFPRENTFLRREFANTKIHLTLKNHKKNFLCSAGDVFSSLPRLRLLAFN